jgi:hypothetical protein
LRVGDRSFGFSGQTSATQTDLSTSSNIAAFVDVDMWLYNVRNQASQLRLYEPSGSGTNFTAFRAQAQASDITYTLPASLTPTNTVVAGILQTDASGNLSWVSPSALVGGSVWLLGGNSGTTPWNGSTGNFLGTTDANKLVIATTNTGTPQPIELWVGNQPTLILNAPGTAAPAWSIQRGGGNQRGIYAVDLQGSRSAAAQVASGNYSAIVGGHRNTASGQYSVVSGGDMNTASGEWSFVGGGQLNTASNDVSVVGGGQSNTASGLRSFVGGGWNNTASGDRSFVGGGESNTASGEWGVIGGGQLNTASNNVSFVGGGFQNTASGERSVVGGGQSNTASGYASVVGGGYGNTASGDHSFVGAGRQNIASGNYSVIPGGYNLRVGDRSFGFSGQTSATQTDLSTSSNIAAFVDVDMWLYNVRNQASQLRLYEPSGAGTNFTAFRAQAQASDIVYTLPASLTPTNTVAAGILQTDASGNLSWVSPSALGGSGSAWSLTGNSGTNPSTNFLGTTDAQPLVIRVGNQEALRFNPGGLSIQRAGGNARGQYAVDFQGVRAAATQVASGDYSAVVSGQNNTASGQSSFVGSGYENSASTQWSAVVGGSNNTASGQASFVGSGNQNSASTQWSAVVGGSNNTASGQASFVGGGYQNTANTQWSAVAGGSSNTASGQASFVGGGYQNTASTQWSTVAGGSSNIASGQASFVGGGYQNSATGQYAAIAGGYGLQIGDRSFGYSGASTAIDLSSSSNIAAFVDVDMWLYNVRNQASQLRLYEPSGSGTNFTAFRSQAQASDIVYTLPASLTPTNTVAAGILQTDASGNLSWVSPSALGGGNAWSLTGNSGTNPTTNFLGTTDAQPLVIRVGNQETFRFNAAGSSAPAWSIHRGGGNQRGLHAVDLQSERAAATQVASGNYSVIGGGLNNTVSGFRSVVDGGEGNQVSGNYSVIGGGISNTISQDRSVINGGYNNTITGGHHYSTIGGGISNSITGGRSVIGGGDGNSVSGNYSVISGGLSNSVTQDRSAIGGGDNNTISADWSVIGGGASNTITGQYSAIPGGNRLTLGARSFGFSGQSSGTQTNLSASSNIAAFVDVDMWLYNVRNQASQLRLYEPSGSGTNFTAFRAQAQGSDIVYTLPAAAGSPGQVLSIQSVSGSNVTLQWSNVSGSGVATFIRKTTDETVTNNTYQDDDQLVYTASANQLLEFEAHMFISGGGGGIKIRVNIPTGATMKLAAELIRGNSVSYQTFTSNTDEVTANSVAGGGYARIRGIITMGSSGGGGNVQIQWAQYSSNTTGTTVEARSYLKITPVQ